MPRKIFTVLVLTFGFNAAMAGTDHPHISESADPAHWNPTAPWKLPEGYSQTRVSSESDLNIYDRSRNDMTDMMTVNETGPNAGRFLYRTHEAENEPEGGAVSVVDLKNRTTRLLAQNPSWKMVDGIRWTPWGSFLFAEERTGGRIFEFVLNPDRISGTVLQRDAVGRMSHEGIAVDAEGNIYVVDEWKSLTIGCGFVPCGGGIYKFIPDRYGDLSSGKLFVLKIIKGDTREGLGQAAWEGPIDSLDARKDGSLKGGQSYQRPEDLEIIGNTLYASVTEGTVDAAGNENYRGRVIAINLATLRVSNYVKPGVNVPAERGRPGHAGYVTGLKRPDNLAKTPDGKLMIMEDNVPSDIWVAVGTGPVASQVYLFASLSDPKAEGSGIYYDPIDKKTIYVNVQHSAAPDGDGTWAIRKQSK